MDGEQATSESVTTDSRVYSEGNNGQSGTEDISPLNMVTPPIGPKDQNYKMNNNSRGKALIFNHETFMKARELPERKGTGADVKMLKESLEQLKFDQNHKNEDCILVAVLTHGKNDSGKDKLNAFDKLYDVDVLWSYFTADICPGLAGKPKIFFIQACRGRMASEQMAFKKIERDSSRIDVTNPKHGYTIPVEADILVAFSTYEGRVAHRDTEEGSWFIQMLCTELNLNGEEMDMLSILTNVNRRVAIDCQNGRDKQMPVTQSTLTRKLFLGSQPADSNVSRTTELSNMLEQLNQIERKLDQMGKMIETKPPPTPTEKTVSVKKQLLSSWDSLHVPIQTSGVVLPSYDSVFQLGELLKVILEDDKIELPPSVNDNGLLILDFLSCWESLSKDKKLSAYKYLLIFLNEHAKNSKYFTFLKIPDPKIFSSEHCHRRWSQSDATDAGRTSSRINVSKISSLPRRKK
ncbi:hypothetical protein C0J52_03349 [Blattella germanica]|nr:hypothetical protein C0J52_03349 [Blattella germanica]